MSHVRRLTLVTSARDLADFPAHFTGADADELLAGWTALWHPVLLAAAGSLPTVRADYELPDPAHLEGELAIVPTLFDQGDVTTWREQLALHAQRDLVPIVGLADRGQLIATVLAALGHSSDPVEPDLTADFFALGYAFLQVEMLTRLMRYGHLIDAEKLLAAVISAAEAAVAGDAGKARESITAACDLLTQARNHYYPVDVHFIDTALMADSVWGAPLRDDLVAAPWLNVLASGEQLERLAQVEPETAAALRAALAAKPQAACVVGGPYNAGPLCDRAPEALLHDFMRGRQCAERVLGRSSQVFGHFRSGPAPLLPRLLHDLEFRGALLAAFDGGSMPRADQCRTTWTGPDGATVQSLVTAPLDTGKAETFLGMATAISRSMDRDHVATILLAGWPGHRSPYMDDFRRIMRFGPVLGRFVTLDDYFDTTIASDYGFTARLDDFGVAQNNADDTTLAELTDTHNQLLAGLADIASTSVRSDAPTPVPCPLSPVSSANRIAEILGNSSATTSTGLLAVNAWNFDRTLFGESGAAIPHVPGHGFSIVEGTAAPPPVPLVEGPRLRNEYLEVLLDERTGGVQSVHLHGQRGNLFSQQLVFRGVYRHPDEYDNDSNKNLTDLSQMIVDEFVTTESAQEAAMTAVGRLVGNDNAAIATFRQTIHLPRHTRVVRLEMELTPAMPSTEPALEGHFASRIAWRDIDPEIARCVQWLNLPTFRRKFTAAPWTRIDTPTPLTLITPCAHQCERIGERMLDVILPQDGVAGVVGVSRSPQHAAARGSASLRPQPPMSDGTIQSSLAVAVGEPFPAPAALGPLTADASSCTTGIGFEAPRQGWWLHLAAENLVVTHLTLAPDALRALELRALETMGLTTRTTLRLWRPVTQAHRISLGGEVQEPLRINDGHVELEIAPYEWFGVCVVWSES